MKGQRLAWSHSEISGRRERRSCFFSRRSGHNKCCCRQKPLSKLAALEQVVEPADPIPAIAVRLEADAVLAALGLAVVRREQVDQIIAILHARGETDLARLVG